MTAEYAIEKINLSILDDGTYVITIQGKNYLNQDFIRQHIVKKGVYDLVNNLQAELKEAEKAIKQNESAIRMLAKQRDEIKSELQEARELLKRVDVWIADRDLIGRVPTDIQRYLEQDKEEQH